MRKGKQKELNQIINELKWIRKEIVENSNPFVTVLDYKFKLNNGKSIFREQIFKNNNDGSAVIIVPFTESKELLVTVEPRVFTSKKIAVGFPAGYIEKEEKPVDAALRELKEETGYVPQNIYKVDSFYQDEGISAAFNYIFIAEHCKKEFEQDLDKDEFVKYMTFTYDELLELEKLGYISGSNSKLALCRIKERR